MMKKTIVAVLMICAVLVSFTSCGNSYDENEWFSEEELEDCLVPDLPAPFKDFWQRGASVYVSFSDVEYSLYVDQIYEYLKSLSFKLFGTRGEMYNTLAGIGTTYYFKPAASLSEFYVNGAYYFVFSDGWDENERLTFYTLAIYDYESVYVECGSDGFYYNTEIVLREGGAAPLDGGYLLKFNPITYADELVEFLCEGYAPREAAVGERVVVRTCPLLDVDLILYANDMKIEQTYADSEYWEYTFTMPDEKVIVTHKTVGGDPPPAESDEPVLSDYEAWLTSLTVDGIARIEIEKTNPSVYTDRFYRQRYRVEDEAILAELLRFYQTLKLEFGMSGDSLIEGATNYIVDFVLTDGSIHTVSFEASYYTASDGTLYRTSDTLSLDGLGDCLYSLNVGEERYTVYTGDGARVGEIDTLDALEFVFGGWTGELEQYAYTHYLDTEIGRLYVVSKTDFIFVPDDELIAPEYFVLQNGSFYDRLDV